MQEAFARSSCTPQTRIYFGPNSVIITMNKILTLASYGTAYLFLSLNQDETHGTTTPNAEGMPCPRHSAISSARRTAYHRAPPYSAEPIRAASLGFAWSPTASINRGRRRTSSREIRRSFARLYATWPATTRAPPRFGREEPKRVCHHTSSRRYRSGAERDTRRTSHVRETGNRPSRKPGVDATQ